MLTQYWNTIPKQPFAGFILSEAYGHSESLLVDIFKVTKTKSPKTGLSSNSRHHLKGSSFYGEVVFLI